MFSFWIQKTCLRLGRGYADRLRTFLSRGVRDAEPVTTTWYETAAALPLMLPGALSPPITILTTAFVFRGLFVYRSVLS